MKILALDPSFTAFGWAVIHIENKQISVIDSGAIKTEPTGKKHRVRKSDDLTRRIKEIAETLDGLVREHSPVLIVTEDPHGSQSHSGAVMVGGVKGIIQTLGTCYQLSIEWFSEQEAKKSLLNKRTATKKEIVSAISKIYGENWHTDTMYKDEAIADALAVFHVSLKESTALNLLFATQTKAFPVKRQRTK